MAIGRFLNELLITIENMSISVRNDVHFMYSCLVLIVI